LIEAAGNYAYDLAPDAKRFAVVLSPIETGEQEKRSTDGRVAFRLCWNRRTPSKSVLCCHFRIAIPQAKDLRPTRDTQLSSAMFAHVPKSQGDAAEKNARWVPLDRPIVVERPDVPQVFSDPYLSLQISFLNAS
jgi:hypothetical protein